MNLRQKVKRLLPVLLLAASTQLTAQTYPFQDKSLPVEQRVEDLINRMTIEEKIDLLSGYNDFFLHPCERLGIPAFKMADGPLGLASWGLFGKATAFPSALSIASSWNKELAQKVGEMYAQEWRARGIHFLLAPGVNMYRASKSARNFEYWGEDPYLTSSMVVPFIKGVQNGGVIATIKHFAGNDQEFDRYTVSTEVDERTLREIYLRPFEAAVKKAGVKAVMTGYNLVNGIYCTENKFLIDILKKEWGFKGMLMSDWACTYSADKAANHGLDMEMGSNTWLVREKLLPLIKKGIVTEETINDKVRRIYGACISMGFLDRDQKDSSIDIYNLEANQLAHDALKEGIILLKNENQMLPLDKKKIKSIAVIGPNAVHNLVTDRFHNVNGITYGGGGSSKVIPWHITSILEGIRNEFSDAKVYYAQGISNQYKNRLFKNSKFLTSTGKQGLEGKYYALSTKENVPSAARQAERAMISGHTSNKELNEMAQNTIIASTDVPAFTQINPTINFSWWESPGKPGELGNEYKVEWNGIIPVEKSDSITVFVDAQGAYQLFIDEKLCLDASTSQSFDCRNYTFYGNKGEKHQIRLTYNNQRSTPSEIRMGYDYKSNLDFSEAIKIAKKSDLVVFCGGLDGSMELEGRDRPFELPYGQDQLINELVKVNPNIVVTLHAGGGVCMTPWIDKVPAVLHLLYPGQEGGTVLAETLEGKVVPSAKLPFTIEKRWEDSPAYGYYDNTRREKKIYYREGIFMGYRGYDRNQVTPLFPFGFGLSYTTFKYADLHIDAIDKHTKQVDLSFTITNTGKYEGAEVAQVYVKDVKAKEIRPLKELKSFEKVFLAPQETKRVSITLDKEAFMYFNSKRKEWVVEKGEFEIWIGSSSQDIRLKTTIKL